MGRVLTPVVGLLAVPGRVVTPLLVLTGRVDGVFDGAVYQQVTEPVRSLLPVQVYGFMQQVPSLGLQPKWPFTNFLQFGPHS